MDSLEAAIDELRLQTELVLAEGGLPQISAIRTFEPDQRVQARIEISTGRMLRRREAGVDVMGDGSLVAYVGATFKSRLRSPGGDSAFELVQEALSG